MTWFFVYLIGLFLSIFSLKSFMSDTDSNIIIIGVCIFWPVTGPILIIALALMLGMGVFDLDDDRT